MPSVFVRKPLSHSAGRSTTSRRRRCHLITSATRAFIAASRSAARRTSRRARRRRAFVSALPGAPRSAGVLFGLVAPRAILLHGVLRLLLRAVLDLLGLARLLGFRGSAGRGTGGGAGQAAARQPGDANQIQQHQLHALSLEQIAQAICWELNTLSCR